MTQLFKNPEKMRKGSTIATKYIPLSVKMSKFFIYKYIKTYNNIHKNVRAKQPKQFKNEIKMMVKAGTVSDSMD